MAKNLDPRAQVVVDFIRQHESDYSGTIMPKWLPAALPSRSAKRGWRDAVALLLLAEIIGVHRVRKDGSVYFTNPLYYLRRVELAKKFCSDVDQISQAANWLRQLGVIELHYRTRVYEYTGEAVGTDVFVFPVMAVLEKYRLDYLQTGQRPKPVPYTTPQRRGPKPKAGFVNPVVDGSPNPKSGFTKADERVCILTAPKEQRNSEDEVGGDGSMQRHDDHRREAKRTIAGDGGGEAADKDMQIPATKSARESFAPRPTATTPSSNGSIAPSSNGHGHHAAAPAALWREVSPPKQFKIQTPDQKSHWRGACRLCALYGQAIMRLGIAATCQLSQKDHIRAYRFFEACPQSHSFYVAGLFIQAYFVASNNGKGSGHWDAFWHLRHATDFGKFITFVHSGRVESQIGCAETINTWYALRMCFTQSELLASGWKAGVPTVAIRKSDLWEHYSCALAYYRDRDLPVPVEVKDAVATFGTAGDVAGTLRT